MGFAGVHIGIGGAVEDQVKPAFLNELQNSFQVGDIQFVYIHTDNLCPLVTRRDIPQLRPLASQHGGKLRAQLAVSSGY